MQNRLFSVDFSEWLFACASGNKFKGRYDAEKNAVVISLEENEFENEC